MHPFICFYFQVHQPYRLRDVRITEVGEGMQYFDQKGNKQIFRKVADKCYLPANKLLLEVLEKHPHFRIAYSLSGVFLEQCQLWGQDVLESFTKLAATGRVEFLAETYYHSLSSVLSLEEFCEQVTQHMDTMERLFDVRPKVFRNTELIYSNHIAEVVRLLGFTGIVTEGVDHLLNNRSPNIPYVLPHVTLPHAERELIASYRQHAARTNDMHVLLKNYRLSDDIAFRFSDHTWLGFPLTAKRFTDWITKSNGHCVNLFMDYETFGEHQWEETGIFTFLQDLPQEWEERHIRTATPSEVLIAWDKQEHEEYDVHSVISWADMERDLSAWNGNSIQECALEEIYALEADIKRINDAKLLRDWRRLQTSDHFYYMCTKSLGDGDVHSYFNPYDSPYEAYRRFRHALADIQQRVYKQGSSPHSL